MNGSSVKKELKCSSRTSPSKSSEKCSFRVSLGRREKTKKSSKYERLIWSIVFSFYRINVVEHNDDLLTTLHCIIKCYKSLDNFFRLFWRQSRAQTPEEVHPKNKSSKKLESNLIDQTNLAVDDNNNFCL